MITVRVPLASIFRELTHPTAQTYLLHQSPPIYACNTSSLKTASVSAKLKLNRTLLDYLHNTTYEDANIFPSPMMSQN